MSLVYNFRPHGSDPFKSVMEVMLLGPGTPGADAPRVSERRLAADEDYHKVPELGFFGAILNQDTANLDYIMNGKSEAHTSDLQSLMRSSYAVFCLKKKPTHVSRLLPPKTTN